jgi:hypothetical protein
VNEQMSLYLSLLVLGQGVALTLLVGDRLLLKSTIRMLEREVGGLREDVKLLRTELVERLHHLEREKEHA